MTNEIIAKDVMEWEYRNPENKRPGFYDKDGKHHGLLLSDHKFLTDHNAAVVVVEKMYSDGYFFSMDNDHVNNKYDVMFFGKGTDHDAQHESLCHAICAAALKAKGK